MVEDKEESENLYPWPPLDVVDKYDANYPHNMNEG